MLVQNSNRFKTHINYIYLMYCINNNMHKTNYFLVIKLQHFIQNYKRTITALKLGPAVQKPDSFANSCKTATDHGG